MHKLDAGSEGLADGAFVQYPLERPERRLPAEVLVDKEGDTSFPTGLNHLLGCLIIGSHWLLTNHRDFVLGGQVNKGSVCLNLGDNVDEVEFLILFSALETVRLYTATSWTPSTSNQPGIWY